MKRSNKVIFIGGSAGALDVLKEILALLPANFMSPIVIVTHRMRNMKSRLDTFFQSHTKIRVMEVTDKMPIEENTIYIAPANYHLLIEEGGTFALDYSELENHSRPAIDPTFETAAQVYGKNAIAVLLSGANNDGADGLLHIKAHKGITIIQDPTSTEHSDMPRAAMKMLKPDHILTPSEIAKKLMELV